MGDLFVKPQAKSGSIRRGLSPTLWHQAPVMQIMSGDLGEGFGFIDDFLTFDDASVRWLLTAATSGTTALDTAEKGGVLLLDSGAATNNQGPQIQMGGAVAACSFIPSAASKIYFETRLKLVTIGSTTVQFFAGLSEVDTTLLAAAANSSANHVGFEAINTTSVTFAAEVGGSRTADTSAGTIADGTYIKLGFLIDGVSSVTPYIDGVAGTKQTAGIPTAEVTPSLTCHSSGTTQPVMHVDWVACFQAEQISN